MLGGEEGLIHILEGKDNPALGGKSVWVADANLGVCLYQQDYDMSVGLSVNHVFDNDFQSFFSEVLLIRTGQFFIQKKLHWAKELKFGEMDERGRVRISLAVVLPFFHEFYFFRWDFQRAERKSDVCDTFKFYACIQPFI